MAFHVRDPETDTMLREFATECSVGLTEAIKVAVREARLARAAEMERRLAGLRQLRAELASWPRTGLSADRDFYDSLNDEEN